MKNIKFLAVAAMAALALSGCTKEINGQADGDKVVVLKVVQAAGETRAEASSTGEATITLGAGTVFFTDASGTITRKVEIVASGAVGADQVSASAIAGAGATIPNVPSNSTKCYILSKAANDVSGVVLGDNISELTSMAITLANMVDATANTVINVPLYGVGDVTPDGNELLKTTVQVGALGARLQVSSFEGITDIVSYRIDGIFVNNFYATMPISKTLAANAVINYFSDPDNYTGAAAGYTTYPSLKDFDATGLGKNGNGGALERVPKNTSSSYTNPVWAYNIFPTEGVPSEGQAGVFPMIVVRLSNVVWHNGTTDETLDDPQFLTIKGMTLSDAPVANIKARHVYTYSNIQFERKDLTTVPVVNAINAEVKIDLLKWIPQAVDPVL